MKPTEKPVTPLQRMQTLLNTNYGHKYDLWAFLWINYSHLDLSKKTCVANTNHIEGNRII